VAAAAAAETSLPPLPPLPPPPPREAFVSQSQGKEGWLCGSGKLLYEKEEEKGGQWGSRRRRRGQESWSKSSPSSSSPWSSSSSKLIPEVAQGLPLHGRSRSLKQATNASFLPNKLKSQLHCFFFFKFLIPKRSCRIAFSKAKIHRR